MFQLLICFSFNRFPAKPFRTPFLLLIVTTGLFAEGFLAPAQAQRRDPFRSLRHKMVEEYLEREGITNRKVLDTMREVPRHKFVGTRHRRSAYYDAALPIGYKQTISPPFIVAYMTQSIDPQKDDKVLEIGTGSGYQAAVLSGLVDEVYTIEIVEQLGRRAEKRLKRLGYDNVTAKVGDGYKGWSEHAPFDKIIVTCSPEDVPTPLIEQLKEGGKMIIPLGQRYQQVFYLFEKKDGELVKQKLIPTLFVPMTGISEEKRDVKPDPLNPQIVNGGFERDSNEDGRADNWHYQRQASLIEAKDARQGSRYIGFENSDPERSAQALQGMAVNGREIQALRLELYFKTENARPGEKSFQKPGFIIHFYDATRRPIGEEAVGPWVGTWSWQKVSKKIDVPAEAREAVVRIGMNGGTGKLYIDGIQLTPEER